MDSSRRAVESYWRSRLIDAATSNEDRVTPVYKIEEICELLRSSHVSIVKEVSEFILKRLDHKSPIVKQKALRVIKYAVGKSGVEFQREMQRHSVAVRQLIHYRGQPDHLKGDALNKAVRDTAQETLSAIFSEQDQKPAPVGTLNKRMEGFGNTNFSLPSEDKKSFLSEVVGIGSASIMQGISSFTQGHSFKKNDNGSYRGPNLHRSLTMQNDSSDRYQPVSIPSETQGNFGSSNNVGSGVWNSNAITSNEGASNGDTGSSHAGNKTREERLLETIVTSGGVRLQPTRDALQAFLMEAAKLDALALTWALESKLQSPQWQVRMKAVCVLDSIVRKKDDDHFSIIASYFCENQDLLIRCSESPQASLRDKTNKVLSLLGGGGHTENVVGNSNSIKTETAKVVQIPDLIDTGDSDNFYGTDASTKEEGERNLGNSTAHAAPLIDDLFGDGVSSSVSTSNAKGEDDPFADVSFHHTNEDRGQVDDIFAGMTLDSDGNLGENKSTTELADIFGSGSSLGLGKENLKTDVNNLMAGLSIAQDDLCTQQKSIAQGNLSEDIFSNMERHSSQQVPDDPLSKIIGSQGVSTGANMMFPPVTMSSPGMTFGSAFPGHPINYAAMGNLFAQQQFLAAMSNLQYMGSLNTQNGGINQAAGNAGGYSSPLPDIFQSNFQTQVANSTTNTKKEETKAFDFISDHVAAARDPKRIV